MDALAQVCENWDVLQDHWIACLPIILKELCLVDCKEREDIQCSLVQRQGRLETVYLFWKCRGDR